MFVNSKEIAELEFVYLFLDGSHGINEEYFPFIPEIEEQRTLCIFTSEKRAKEAASQMKEYMELDEKETIYIAKINQKEELAVLLEFCLHGGTKLGVDTVEEQDTYEIIDLLDDLYETLGYQRMFDEESREFPEIIWNLYQENISFYTLPKATTTGEQIMDNQFLTIHEKDDVLFFLELDTALQHYEKEDLPSEWNLKSDFRQVVQLLLYSFDYGMKKLIIVTEDGRVSLDLAQALWMIQKVARKETYLLLKGAVMI